MGYSGLLHIQALLGQSQFLSVVPVRLFRVIFFTLRSVLVWVINYKMTIDVGLETQCLIFPLIFFFPISHQMLILCIESFSLFHQLLVIVRRLTIRGNVSRLAKKKKTEK